MQEDAWQKEAKWFTWDEAIELANYFNSIKFGKEMHLWSAFPSGGLATVWLKGESGHEGTLFDFKNGEFRPMYKSKSGRMTVRLVRGEMLK